MVNRLLLHPNTQSLIYTLMTGTLSVYCRDSSLAFYADVMLTIYSSMMMQQKVNHPEC